MATGDPDDDAGVEAGARDEEVPLVAELPALLLLAALLPVALLPTTVTLCCAVPGRTVTIPATLRALSAPAPAVMAATFFFARRRAAWAAETWLLFIVMRPACRPRLHAA